MGKLDRRNSLKMRQRKAQAKKKARAKNRAAKKTVVAAPVKAKKSRAKAAPPAAE
jgi:hypothetical protein